MAAPPGATAAITPLSTMLAASRGTGTVAEAEARLRDDLGSTHAFAGDFTAVADPAQRAAAALLARSVALALQTGRASLQSAIGQPDAGSPSKPMTEADMDIAAANGVAGMLKALSASARDAAAAAATASTPAERDTVLKAAVAASVAANFAINAGNVAVFKALNDNGPETRPHVATGGSSLAWFTWQDSDDWFFREFRSTLAEDTPDAAGTTRFTEARRRSVNGIVANWGAVPEFTRTDLYWTGSRWLQCPTGHVHSQNVPDAEGVRVSTYCDSIKSRNTRITVDIAGRTLASVVAGIRAHPLPSTQGSFAQWGPDPASGVLGSAVFPAGSELRYQTTVQTGNPDAYNPIPANRVFVFSDPVVSGQQAACNVSQTPAVATTLEQLVAASPGTPCVYPTDAANGSRNEWWGNSVTSMGFDVEGPPPALPIYRAARAIRVAFSGTSTATYYSCARYASSGSVRNCDAIGTGTFSIQTLGDGRVLQLTNQPAILAPAGFSRVFVEREGTVWFGYRTRLSTDHTVRLNGPATDALFTQLGVTR